MNRIRIIHSAALVLLFSVGCTYETFDSASELDVVVTVKSGGDDYDYSANRTWTMPPEVLDLSEFVQDPVDIPHRYDDLILETITDRMESLGYEYVPWPESTDTDTGMDTDTDTDTNTDGDTESETDEDEEAGTPGLPPEVEDMDVDLIVLPGIIASENWAYYGYYYYYGYYWYGYYPVTTVAVNYESGTLLISMLDKSETMESDDGEVIYLPVWTAGLHGLLDYIDGAKLSGGIDQAFAQSPYLEVDGARGGN